MTNTLITEIVVAVAIVGSIAAFFGWVAVPAIKARRGGWDRLAAGVLSVYAFGVFAALGVAVGIGIIWAWPQIT